MARVQHGVSLSPEIWAKLYAKHRPRVSLYIEKAIIEQMKKDGELTPKEKKNLETYMQIGNISKEVSSNLFAANASKVWDDGRKKWDKNVRLGLCSSETAKQKKEELFAGLKKSILLESNKGVNPKNKGIPPSEMTSERREKLRHFKFNWLQEHDY